jgi:hypothetical protein
VSAALAFSLACDKKGKGSSGSDDDTKTESAKDAKADLTVDAKDIIKDYKENEVAADEKYKNKIVQVSGVVNEIKKDFMDEIYVSVNTGKELEFEDVWVYFDGDATKKAKALKKGDKITVKGKVTGLMLMSVQMKDSVFVE